MDRTIELKKLGTLIRQAREKAGMTQLELGSELGFGSGQFISNLERGIKPMPPKHVAPVARALRIDADELLSHLVRIQSLKIRERSIET